MVAGFIFMISSDCNEGKMVGPVIRLSRACLPLLLLALTSCSSSDTAEQQTELASSTAQAAAMVTDAWLSGAAPSCYASSALLSFAETLADAARQVQSASPSDPAKRDALSTAFSRLSNAANRAASAVKTEHHAQADQAQQELRAAQGDLAKAYSEYFAPQR
ncbi:MULTISPECIES: hypothetical protein [Mesorhizobium]|uniref:Uncharacterized protein n=1 Tax=Mesorhizobium opportunistum (strain LMG 24607 / HAMBI 3007 / WSM2075) TaxID=536019 RepID=F7Y8P4_MESOW|nr:MULTISPECIES: hypothetical protein [Mesorhizobium]AEH90905.1 hypothetical protein Mesop_6583 [Mesorhizobium opportunistum WSM2075]MCA0032094.1 hypothetical protein [Mesorhizobium sp. B263B2A]TPN51285.1 hypothetical protein FJ978_13190 [Mesorhizobium sp. B1-1-7]TPN56548.1 hypothetical protein FJ976_05820 [Mesorhizobium sp. B1-1-9]